MGSAASKKAGQNGGEAHETPDGFAPAPEMEAPPEDGVLVGVVYEEGNARIAFIGPVGDTRVTEVQTLLESALRIHRQNLGLTG